MAGDDAGKGIMDGTAWARYCDTLKLAGLAVMRESAPSSPLDRAEGFRYLARLTRVGLEAFVERSDPLAPTLFRPVHETVKMGADNPDNHYFWAAVSGEHDYRVSGSRGTVNYLGLGTYVGSYGSGRTDETGYVEAKDLAVGPDGRVEVVLSCREQLGNWLPMRPETGQLIVRQTFLDRSTEVPADLRIERLGGDGKPSPLTPARVEEGLTKAGQLVAGGAAMFASWAEDFQAHTNELPLFDPARSLAAGGDPNIVYYHSYWRLAPSEALVVEARPPECTSWNFQVNNHWMESLDYRYFRIAINKREAVYEPDGSVRIVVAHEDPGLPNWLETAGHEVGTMCFRWIGAAEHPQPRARVVALEALRRGER